MDRTQSPLLRVTLYSEVTDADFQVYLEDSDRVVRDGKPYALVYDATRGHGLSVLQRRRQSQWIRDNDASLRRLCLGGSFAITSTLVRGALTAVLWVAPFPFPHIVVGSVAEAEDWLRDRLASGGVSLAV